ncbi:HI0074 family nucleotidyltransferase substrate-binding subunit [Caldanaerobacter subterraneus]|uniref:Nucleotidyltransferase substrate binding protein (TIGR01987 family) n=1 Tax=Caldanaerobacter subterraneus TaxID=911092 RepID=A0A4R2JJS6_9THEO|nr:HI0074 family nucleotidyltransferase substrate-binding subunit [Caldanaerobacter subterraneus]TCO60233.1 nucleotidyltransferase substrate binding protein (TIGR01987 family) [Caldanaerobacter subterraneus]
MRGKVRKFFEDFEKAFLNLKNAVEMARDDLDVDGTIKRFEICYELSWKLMKEYLADVGVIVKNPRNTFKEAFNNDLIEDVETWMQIIEDRNLLVHTYTLEESREVFNRIKGKYIIELEKFYLAMQKRIQQEDI